jgi:hypothetical protein
MVYGSHCRCDPGGTGLTNGTSSSLSRSGVDFLTETRGSTYTSESYLALVQEKGMVSSMSRTANWYDNAVTESFCA